MSVPSAIEAASAQLRTRERIGLTLVIVALALTINPVNREVRFWVRDQFLGGGVPFWLDNMLIMVTFQALFWGSVGLLLLGRRGAGLAWPDRPREAWLVSVLSGLTLVGLIVPALALSGALVWQFKIDVLVSVANLISNFEEELIHRGVILALLLVALGRNRAWLASVIEGALFCQGHHHYPLPLLLAVFVAGVLWCWMTIRYSSIWPAWGSHMVADVVGGLLLKS
jgi:membrane protease YdiL (CAAX protease family)